MIENQEEEVITEAREITRKEVEEEVREILMMSEQSQCVSFLDNPLF